MALVNLTNDVFGFNHTESPGTDAPSFQYQFSAPTSTLTAFAGIVVIWWYLVTVNRKKYPNIYGNYDFDAPIIGYKHMIPARLQFFRNGPAMIKEGYEKYKDTFFKVSGNDLLIVPNKYLAELASMPPEKLSLNTAIVDAFQRLHSITAVITDHSLQSRMLMSRLTPKLGVHVPLVQDQFRKYLPQELPAAKDEWTSINALHLARRMVHRGVATQFVAELAEDEEYLSTAIAYSENGFRHNFLLRVFPDFAKPVVARFLPTSWAWIGL